MSRLNRHKTGITPACAGKRRWALDALRRAWDHPRVCGEKGFGVPVSSTMRGSPPRVRGKDLRG